MASTSETLPEGTDTIIEDSAVLAEDDQEDTGAEETSEDASDGQDGTLKDKATAFREQAGARAAEFRDKANDQVFAFAAQGKDRVTESLDGVARYVEDIATQIEEKVGPQYGGYARQAADAVSGFATSLRGKDVEELFEEARGYVRQSPAIAIGAAAAAGFLIARLVKAGSEALDATARDLSDKPGEG